jgi:O-antigen/teichoic acid export membrane protein
MNIKSISLGAASRLASIGSYLVLLPVLTSTLNDESITIWFLFASFYSVVVLLDFGFSSTISRFFSYAIGGAKKLESDGFSQSKLGEINELMFVNLIKATDYIFFRVTFAAIVVMSSVFLYYNFIVSIYFDLSLYFSWVAYTLAIIFNVYALKYNGLLHGTGDINKIYLNNLICNLFFVILSLFTLLNGFGLISICIIKLITNVLLCLLNHIASKNNAFFIKCKSKMELLDDSDSYEDVYKKIKESAFKVGLGTLGGFLGGRSSMIILSTFVALASLSGFSFYFNVSIVILSMSLIIVNNEFPVLARKLQSNDLLYFRKSSIKVIISSLLVFALLYPTACVSLLLLKEGFQLELPVLDNVTLIFLFLVFFSELLVSILTQLLSAMNRLVFYKTQIGLGCVFISFCFVAGAFDYLSIKRFLALQLAFFYVPQLFVWPFVILKFIRCENGSLSS